MKDFWNYIWQLPQNLLGLLVKAFYKVDNRVIYKGSMVHVCNKFPGGISLGNTIIVKTYPTNKNLWDNVKHEYGHQKQSEEWGWLYLIVIGLPSIVFNIWDRLFHDDDEKWVKWYYNLPWEKDADKKGNVSR